MKQFLFSPFLRGRGKLSFIALVPALLCCAAPNLNAQNASEYSLYDSMNTFLGQGNTQVNGTQAVMNNSCVPTSTANGLSFLEQYAASISMPDPFASTPDSYATVNSLQTLMGTTAKGTTVAGQQAGVGSYLTANAPSVTLGNTFDPSAMLLGNLLNSDIAIQLGILWGTNIGSSFPGTNGGHFVSLVSMNLTGGTGTMTILDPWGNNTTGAGINAGTNATFQTLFVTTLTLTNGPFIGTYLDVTYTNTGVLYVGPDDTTAADGTTAYGDSSAMTGLIAVDTIEAVPEPASFALLAVGVFGLWTIRLGRQYFKSFSPSSSSSSSNKIPLSVKRRLLS
jgi:hypothetical protein